MVHREVHNASHFSSRRRKRNTGSKEISTIANLNQYPSTGLGGPEGAMNLRNPRKRGQSNRGFGPWCTGRRAHNNIQRLWGAGGKKTQIISEGKETIIFTIQPCTQSSKRYKVDKTVHQKYRRRGRLVSSLTKRVTAKRFAMDPNQQTLRSVFIQHDIIEIRDKVFSAR